VNTLTLNVARDRAANVLDDLRRGIDPKHKAPTFTLQAALDDYIAARPNLRARQHKPLSAGRARP
jgi:hypothetical protein